MLQLQRNDRFPPHCEGVGASAIAVETTRGIGRAVDPSYCTPSTTAAALRSWRRDGAGIARQRVNAPASSADDSG